jgi:hypothetical protein
MRVLNNPPSQGPAGEIVGASDVLRFRSDSQFSNRCTTTKNVGTNSTARQVEAIMPENTVMPIDLRALAPAPVAITSGTTPRMLSQLPQAVQNQGGERLGFISGA